MKITQIRRETIICASKKFINSNQDKLKEIQTKTPYSHIIKTKYMALHCSNYNIINFLVFELGRGFTSVKEEREGKGWKGWKERKEGQHGSMIRVSCEPRILMNLFICGP